MGHASKGHLGSGQDILCGLWGCHRDVLCKWFRDGARWRAPCCVLGGKRVLRRPLSCLVARLVGRVDQEEQALLARACGRLVAAHECLKHFCCVACFPQLEGLGARACPVMLGRVYRVLTCGVLHKPFDIHRRSDLLQPEGVLRHQAHGRARRTRSSGKSGLSLPASCGRYADGSCSVARHGVSMCGAPGLAHG